MAEVNQVPLPPVYIPVTISLMTPQELIAMRWLLQAATDDRIGAIIKMINRNECKPSVDTDEIERIGRQIYYSLCACTTEENAG